MLNKHINGNKPKLIDIKEVLKQQITTVEVFLNYRLNIQANKILLSPYYGPDTTVLPIRIFIQR